MIFERLLLVGIGVHLFTQVFIMAGGTLNLLPVTGVTILFSQPGRSCPLVNLLECRDGPGDRPPVGGQSA
jgi:cell division protein FtsW (lipid II flippase)